MVKHLLDIIKGEATKDSKATIQPDVLSERQSANSSSWENKWSESRDSDNGNTSKERSTKVKVFVGLSSSTNKGDRAHHSNGVKTSSCHDSWRSHEHQRRNEHSLRSVETSPQSVLLDIVFWIRCPSSKHSTERKRKTTDHDDPWVGGHNTVDEAGSVHCSGCDTDDSNAQTGVQEGLVEVCAFVEWHAAVLARLAVEHEVDG